MKNRLRAAWPLIITFLYLLLSFTTKLWSITWILFLFTPTIYVVTSKTSFRKKMISVINTLLISTYFVVSILSGKWNVTWLILIFLGILNFAFSLSFSLHSVFNITIIAVFLFLGFQYSLWHPGWIIFILIPILEILVPNKKIKMNKDVNEI